MAVKLVTKINRYIGIAAEIAAIDLTGIPAGSTFFESDTGILKTLNSAGALVSAPSESVQVAGSLPAGTNVIGVIGIDPAANAVQLSGSNLQEATVLNVTLAGIRQQLPDIVCGEIMIIAKRGNTGYIYVGNGTVSSTDYGVELGELDCITLPVNNANQIYIDASVSGEGISYVTV
jgi:hypothetical protein